MKTAVIQNPVFKHTLTFWVGNLEETLSKLRYHLGIKAARIFESFVQEDSQGVFTPDLEGFPLLWIREGIRDESEFISTLSHEIVHLVMTLLRDRGVPISLENQETFAYLVGFYTKECLKQLKESDDDRPESTELEG